MCGQYFLVVNLDKSEFIHPHRVGSGLKLWEICANNVSRLLPFLLRQSSEGGGGDYRGAFESEYAGRWAGDRIVVIGDYDESGLYEEVSATYKEIGANMAEEFNAFIEVREMMVGDV